MTVDVFSQTSLPLSQATCIG